jgi:hypothetical protein
MKIRLPLLILTSFLIFSCEKVDPSPSISEMYFPPIQGSSWETVNNSELGWKQSELPSLLDFLRTKNTKSFLILVNGKIALEEYFDGHTANTMWQWNSAGKTLVTATTGIAQIEGLIDIYRPVSLYLGQGWTNMPLNKENLITPRSLLTMTSGINDESELHFVTPISYNTDTFRVTIQIFAPI